MKFLILFALVAAVSADFHDDTFHFSTSGVSSGLQQGAFLQSASPVLTKKYTAFTPAYTQQYASLAQPAYTQQYYKAAAAPVLIKSVEHEIPVYQQQYAVKQIVQPVYSQYSTLKQVAQPVYSQQYAVKKAVQPVYAQYAAVKQIAQPVYSQYSAVKEIAQPVYSQYSTVKQIAQPVYSQYAVKQIAQPVYSQYSAVKEIAQPAFSQEYAYKQLAQPALSQYSVKVAKPLVAQQYSAASLSGVSTYAAGYTAPQFRILSQVQEADPAGPYKLSYATENGIQATEQGALVAGAEGAVIAAQGSYSYTGPDGQVYSVNYIADENGFRAAGDHLPTPPPVPAEILKSLEENASSSEQYDDQGRLVSNKK